MSTIITRNSANSGSIPASLIQGELAINVTDGRLFYGSGSGNIVKEFTASGSGNIDTSSFATTGSNQFNGNQSISGTLHQSGTFYPDQIDWFSSSIGYDTGSYILTTTNNGLTTYANYPDVANELSQYITVISASHALTASYVNPLHQTVQITGSLTTTGSNTLVGDTYLTGSFNLSGSQVVKGYIEFLPVTTNIDPSISASYIYVSGSTNDLYFSQNGDGYANTTRLRWLEGNLYTGLLNGGLITSQSSTVYQISSGSGIIVNLNASITNNPYPTIQYVNWPNLSASIAPLSASFDQSFVAITSSGGTAVITTQGTPYIDGEYNTKIPIGIVIHQNRSTINAFQTFPSVGYGWKQRSYDFIKAFGPLKIAGYNLSVSGSSTGSLVLSGGTAWVDGRNYIVDPNNPSYITEATGITTSKIYRYRQSGSGWVYDTNGGAGYPVIDPTQYSLNGVLTPVATNNWTLQRVFYFPNSATKAFYIYYGNAEYSNKSDAIAAILTETFNEAPNTAANAIFVGYMVLRHNANFTVAASYEFRAAGLFRQSGAGGAGGGGGGATSLASLSDVSLTTPTYGDLLMYDSTYWYNTKTLSGSYTLSGSLTTNDGINVQSLTASFISASNITGSLLAPQSLDSQNRYLIDSSNTQSINWNNRQAFDSTLTLSTDWQLRSSFDAINIESFNWGGRQLINDIGSTAFNWSVTGNGNKIIQYAYKYTQIDTTNQDLFATSPLPSAEGEIIGVTTNIDPTVLVGDLVSLDKSGIWYQNDQSNISASSMLGIAVGAYNKGFILTEGNITVTTASGYTDVPFVAGTDFYGKPVYMRDGVLGGLTTDKPTTGYIRIVGHLYYNSVSSPDFWIMKFRPSNDWYEI